MQFCEGSASGVNKWRPRPPKCWNNVAVDRSPRCCFNRWNSFRDPYRTQNTQNLWLFGFMFRAFGSFICESNNQNHSRTAQLFTERWKRHALPLTRRRPYPSLEKPRGTCARVRAARARRQPGGALSARALSLSPFPLARNTASPRPPSPQLMYFTSTSRPLCPVQLPCHGTALRLSASPPLPL